MLCFKKFSKRTAILLFFVIITINQSAFAKTTLSRSISLHNTFWRIDVIPETLTISCKPFDHGKFAISIGQSDLGSIKIISVQDNIFTYELLDRKIVIRLHLKDRKLNVNIRSADDTVFSFPIIEQSENLAGLIVPHRQGLYIPTQNQEWRKTLRKTRFNTTEGLTMPFLGFDIGTYTLTYIMKNRFNNVLSFKYPENKMLATVSHTFNKNHKKKEISFSIRLGKEYSPVEPAKEFRRYLMENQQFVSMEEKAKKIPKISRLKGALHAYLWGNLGMTFDDMLKINRWHYHWKPMCASVVSKATSNSEPSIEKRIQELIPKKYWKLLEQCKNSKYSSEWDYIQLAEGFTKLFAKADFYKKDYFKNLELPKEVQQLIAQKENLTKAQIFRKNSLLFWAAYPKKVRHPDEWGYGYSTRMLKELKKAGIDRARLVHDIWDFGMLDLLPQVAKAADEMGFLLGPYDNYTEVHNPRYFGTDHSYATAQFDKKLYQYGGIQLTSGKRKAAYLGKGNQINPIYARPWVEKRINRILNATPFNSYFIDADAYGELYDDYSTLHPASQEEIKNSLVDRLRWISETHKLVIGSEGGASYAAPVIHVAEGMMSHPYGPWLDKDFGNRKSPYYLGEYFPPHAPERYLKPVQLKEKYVLFSYKPEFRLPLNEIVFHDSFVSTNHYESAFFKFKNVQKEVELTSLLYMTPPLYHLNIKQFKKKKKSIKKFYTFFSPLHKKIGFEQMTDFRWLSPNRLVQKTKFGNSLEIIANFDSKGFVYNKQLVPPNHVVAFCLDTGQISKYSF